MTEDEKRFAEFDRGMQQALDRIEQLQRELTDAQVQNAAHVTTIENATRALRSIQADAESVVAEKRRLEAKVHNLEQAMRGDDGPLIDEIRELRAYVRRSDEAVRVVAEAIERRFSSHESSDGAELRAWLRRNHVRIVRGDPRPPKPGACPECRSDDLPGHHKMSCSRGAEQMSRKCDACGVVGGHKWRCPVLGGLKYREPKDEGNG